MITVLVSTARASWMMGIFRASHDDKFHSTPAQTETTESHHKSDQWHISAFPDDLLQL